MRGRMRGRMGGREGERDSLTTNQNITIHTAFETDSDTDEDENGCNIQNSLINTKSHEKEDSMNLLHRVNELIEAGVKRSMQVFNTEKVMKRLKMAEGNQALEQFNSNYQIMKLSDIAGINTLYNSIEDKVLVIDI